MESVFGSIDVFLKSDTSSQLTYYVGRNLVNFKPFYIYNPTLLYDNFIDYFNINESYNIGYPRQA